MLSDQRIEFTKDNIDIYLKEVAKEYRKHMGKSVPAEMILIGGASVLINYGFRNMTTDVDAIIQAASAMKDVINIVGDKFGLSNGWLNDDFTRTASYSRKLSEFSNYYRTYSNVLTIRTIDGEYLIAMKLRSGRQYKSDLSDVIGILAEHQKNGKPITMEKIYTAVVNLYGAWEELPSKSRDFIESVMRLGQFDTLYNRTLQSEKETKELLIVFEQEYPGIIQEVNADEIVRTLMNKAGKEAILTQLRKRKENSEVL